MGKLFQGYTDMPGHLARRFQQIAVAVFQAEMEAVGCDLTPVQYAALVAIRDQPKMDQATLAGEIAYDRTTITGVVDRLEKKGFIVREVSARDRRSRELAITQSALETLERITPAVTSAQDLMVRGLSEVERVQFIALLRKAVDAANELSRAPMRE